jgi:hypothetical protein
LIRERLTQVPRSRQPASLDAIVDLIGAIDGLPAGLSAQKKKHLKATGYSQKHSR